jgi:hypothetical protein
MTEDEAQTVAALAAACVWGARRRWGLVMRYGRLFAPGTEAGGGAYPMIPALAGKNAYQLALNSGLLYAEGYACRPPGIPWGLAWCLDGETVVDPGFSEPSTAYFGVALRPDYVRRVHEAWRRDDGSDGFMWVFKAFHEINPPLDPSTDIVPDLGRDIPSGVRDWALTAEPPSDGDQEAPAWVLDELLALRSHDMEPSEAPLPMSYARYLIRRDDGFDSGMSLACSGQTGGIYSDNATILDQIQDGDSLDTLIRMADEHRQRCEWAECPDDEREHPELTVQKRAEVHLRWVSGFLRADRSFAVLHRLDYNVWDAWLHPLRIQGQIRIQEQPVLLTRNGVSYEMALMAVFRAMGDEMPEEFAVSYLT